MRRHLSESRIQAGPSSTLARQDSAAGPPLGMADHARGPDSPCCTAVRGRSGYLVQHGPVLQAPAKLQRAANAGKAVRLVIAVLT